MLGRPQARGKDVSISGPWSQLINWFVRTLIYRKKLFWVQPPCHTHESHWYFVILQIEANIFFLSPITRVLELNDIFANLTKNLEWHPGMGQCLHLSFFMLTVRKLDTNWIKLFVTRNLLLIFKGRSGIKGRKGTKNQCCFSETRGKRARKRHVRG